jgi:glycerate 2-kinase
VHLRARLAAADLVITGEGSFDSQSLQGKVTGRIIEIAHDAGKRAIVLAGRAEASSDNLRTLAELEPDAEAAMANAAALLADLAATLS